MAESSDNDIFAIDKLKSKTGYQVWKFQLSIVLKSKQVWEIVTDEEKASSDPTRKKELREWEKKDAIAQKVIVSSVDTKILTHLMTCETAHSMWQKLTNLFEQSTSESKSQILQEFFSAKYEKGSTISYHICKLEICSID